MYNTGISYQYYSFQGKLLPQNLMFQNILLQFTANEEHFLSFSQTQKRICSEYIKIATDKLYPEEAKRISEANELLEKLVSKEKVKDLSEWDVFSTRDSVILEDDSSFNLSNISFDSKSRIISRKNAMGTRTVRDFDGNINESLMEIEKECSQKTTTLIKKLAEEYKRMRVRAQENQKIEKSTRASQKTIEDLREKQFILNKKLEDAQIELQKLRVQNTNLKTQNKDLSDKVYKKSNQINSEKKIKLYEEIVNKSLNGSTPKKNTPANFNNTEILRQVIQEKQKLIALRLEEIKTIEAKVQEVLFKEDKACNSCCMMLKKMKSSIITFKGYLEKEGQEFEVMVDNFKEKVLKHQKQNQ